MGAESGRSLASRHRLGGAAAVLGLLLPAVAASPAWGLTGATRSRAWGRLLAFGYALPAGPAASYGPPSFYPPGTPTPAEELPFEEAVAAARQSRAQRIERFPAFPETPAALAHEISGVCVRGGIRGGGWLDEGIDGSMDAYLCWGHRWRGSPVIRIFQWW